MSAKEIKLKFTLRLNIDEWGKYKKGDTDIFYIPVFSELNGLVRFPIDKRWDIVDYVVCEGNYDDASTEPSINYDGALEAVCCPKCGKDEVETNGSVKWCINCQHIWGN